ncbi:MAG: helix-turn-helix domain-containing protein [Rikenellaceae bacterium]
MKTALIYFPRLTATQVNIQSYLAGCIAKAKSEDCTVLTPCNYDIYVRLATRNYFESIKCAIQVIFLFADFGTDELMNALLEDFSGEGSQIEIRIRRFSEEELRDYRDNITNILDEVADKSNIPVELLASKTRQGEIVKHRQFYCMRAREKTNNSLAQIGRLVGIDHATVLHAIKTVRTTKLPDGRTLLQEYEEFFRRNFNVKKIEKQFTPKLKTEVTEKIEMKPTKHEFIKAIQGDLVPFTGPYMGYKVHSR